MSREWTLRAACRGEPIELFYPLRTEEALDTIEKFCVNCPVIQECGQDAWDQELEANISYGIRAGMTARQRSKLRNSFKKRVRKVVS